MILFCLQLLPIVMDRQKVLRVLSQILSDKHGKKVTCTDCLEYRDCIERRGICEDFDTKKARIQRAKKGVRDANQMRPHQTADPEATTNKGG